MPGQHAAVPTGTVRTGQDTDVTSGATRLGGLRISSCCPHTEWAEQDARGQPGLTGRDLQSANSQPSLRQEQVSTPADNQEDFLQRVA